MTSAPEAHPLFIAEVRAGHAAMMARVAELGDRGWRIDLNAGDRVALSAPSYRLPPLVTALLVVATVGVWAVPAWWLRTRRRDYLMVALGPDCQVVEMSARGW